MSNFLKKKTFKGDFNPPLSVFFFLSSGTAVWRACLSFHLSYQQPQGANATNDCRNRDLFPSSHGPQGSPARWQQGEPCIAISCGFPIQLPCSQLLVQGLDVLWECTILLENMSSNHECLFRLSFQVFFKEPEKDLIFFFSFLRRMSYHCVQAFVQGAKYKPQRSESLHVAYLQWW